MSGIKRVKKNYKSQSKIKLFRKPFFCTAIFIFSFCLIVSCKKKEESVIALADAQEGLLKTPESEYDFYSPADDNASWVEGLLAHLEEERIAQELSLMEDSLLEYEEVELPPEREENMPDSDENPAEPSFDLQLSEVEKFFAEQKTERILTGKKSKMASVEFGSEIFVPQKSDGKTVLVHANGNEVIRNFYDLSLRLEKRETWSIPSFSDALLQKTENFVYFEESDNVSEKSITEPGFFEKISYNQAGKVLSSSRYAVTQEGSFVLSKRRLAYDEENFLVSDELIEYNYKDSDYKELAYQFSKKYTYTKNEGEIPPDFRYYENGVLKMQNKYSSTKGEYTSRIYFDGGFSVKTYYENEIRVKEVYYSGKKVTREKVYEKSEQQTVIQ